MCYQSLRVNKIYCIVLSKSYQEVASAVLEASKEGTEKLSVLRVDQCEDE
jgi:hypothetical protein